MLWEGGVQALPVPQLRVCAAKVQQGTAPPLRTAELVPRWPRSAPARGESGILVVIGGAACVP